MKPQKRELGGHPVGLYVLFLTEMWERFSFYGMRTLLVLYMNSFLIEYSRSTGQVIGFEGLRRVLEAIFGPLGTQPLSSQVYGIYTALVYFTPLFGGMLADRLWGQRKTVVVGSLLMAIGHFLMAFDAFFLIAMIFLILGNGCFKPNLATQVGGLYEEGDPRRDRAYTIFYMGLNLGALFSPLVCGTLGQLYGWHYGFSAAGVGMLIGLVVYLKGQKYLASTQVAQVQARESQPLTRSEWRTVLGLIVLCILNITFWGVYEQQGNTMQLFADRNTDWRIFGWEMPSTWFQTFNPLFIITLAPLLMSFWKWQQRRGQEVSSIGKMSIGCFLLGASFLIVMYISRGMQPDDKISFLWLIACTLVYTIGEIYLSPIGMSFVTKASPRRVIGVMMGMWFLSNFFGNYLSGYLGTFYEVMARDQFFLMLVIIGVVTGVVIFAFKKPLTRAIGHEV